MYERILIRVPENEQERNKTRLRRLYSLTEGEADLALLLACGRTLLECAARRGVSLTTVRSHLQNIFGKTDTHRQSELVAVLLVGPARLALECVPEDEVEPYSSGSRPYSSEEGVFGRDLRT